ncbi:MAG: ArsI/CadI family heavy metal resistance metalloenzyme [Woeseiaceae bacterium]|jgi:catechol 2,3-dioxygenase-like lactoylglutathione lyase family enzyme
MKRFHVNVSVADLGQSIDFYNTLFGQEPSVQKEDYAKWMLDDPRVNFAISQSSRSSGINHVGLQADTMDELGEIQARLRRAGEQTFEQPEAECCYARSTKTWVQDPDAVRWETFVTHGQITHYGTDDAPATANDAAARCCA